MNLSDIKSTSIQDRLSKIERRIRKNDTIAEYYDDLYDEEGYETYRNISDRMRKCCQYWDIDYYRFQGVKDLVRTNCCKNMFCDNCQNALAQRRQQKYSPVLELLSLDYDLYHVVFTVPNVVGDELLPTVDKMFKKFGYFIRYFQGLKHIRTYSFEGYGFKGAVRALEVTRNKTTREFHPHFHCIFVMKKNSRLTLHRHYVNSFSFDNSDIERGRYGSVGSSEYRRFTEFEILLQKIWYLLFNDIKVTRDSISNLKEGYSVIVNEVQEGKYHEVFKYAMKGIFKDDSALGGFYDFKALYFALYHRRIIQGYGCLRAFAFDEDGLELESDLKYEDIIAKLRELENPVRMYEFLSQIKREASSNNVTYISRSSVSALFDDDK